MTDLDSQEREALREWVLSPVAGMTIVTHRAGDAMVTGLGGDESKSVRVLEAEPVERELGELRAALAAREEPQPSDKEAMDAAWLAYYGSHNVPDKHEGKLYAWQNAWHAALAHARSAARAATGRCGSCGLEHSFEGDCGKPLSYWREDTGRPEAVFEVIAEGRKATMGGPVRDTERDRKR